MLPSMAFLPFSVSGIKVLLGWFAVTSENIKGHIKHSEKSNLAGIDRERIGKWLGGMQVEVYTAFRWISRLASFGICFSCRGYLLAIYFCIRIFLLHPVWTVLRDYSAKQELASPRLLRSRLLLARCHIGLPQCHSSLQMPLGFQLYPVAKV
jgi:hypothetical protein